MNKFLIIALIGLSQGANAQGAVWSSATGLSTISACEAYGETWQELGTVCHSDKMFRLSPTMPSIVGGNITNSPAPKCPEGYSLILRDLGRPACARDIIDAQ
jgi:hypothetical protein